ncbi:MAG TPA: DUF3105 domain-containing protein [Nocardioidaceae bacterium]|nr:DUF3105 domain-containing protein [Nocardioidaceae bacterium]
MTYVRVPLVAGALLLSLVACSDEEPADSGAIGVAREEAGCAPIRTEPFVTPPSGSHHVPEGTELDYPSPPAAELHHDAFPMPTEQKNLYSAADRPPLPDLVHLTEHGYNVLWYDETIAGDEDAMADLRAIAEEYPTGKYLVIAPWTGTDGDPFPDDKHVTLTHWTGPDDMQSVWEYCDRVSGEVVDEFTAAYTKENSPEPGAP